jgi:hypothetical protein
MCGWLRFGGDFDLAEEAISADRVGQLGMKHLERHRAPVSEIAREIDGRHPTAAELALDIIAVLETLDELAFQVGQ